MATCTTIERSARKREPRRTGITEEMRGMWAAMYNTFEGILIAKWEELGDGVLKMNPPTFVKQIKEIKAALCLFVDEVDLNTIAANYDDLSEHAEVLARCCSRSRIMTSLFRNKWNQAGQ